MATAVPHPLAAQVSPNRRRRQAQPILPELDDPTAALMGAKPGHCNTHAVTYYYTRTDACPACVLDSQLTQAEITIKTLKNKSHMLEQENKRLQVVLNIMVAMREAADLLNEPDLTFLKSILYRWRADRSVKLKGLRDQKHEHPMGLMAVPTKGEPEAYMCTSIGGVAIAGYIDEMNQSHGAEDTMSCLARALHKQLKGGIK